MKYLSILIFLPLFSMNLLVIVVGQSNCKTIIVVDNNNTSGLSIFDSYQQITSLFNFDLNPSLNPYGIR